MGKGARRGDVWFLFHRYSHTPQRGQQASCRASNAKYNCVCAQHTLTMTGQNGIGDIVDAPHCFRTSTLFFNDSVSKTADRQVRLRNCNYSPLLLAAFSLQIRSCAHKKWNSFNWGLIQITSPRDALNLLCSQLPVCFCVHILHVWDFI